MEETLRLHLLQLVDAFHKATGTTAASVGKFALNDNTVFGRLEERKGSFNVRTYDRLVAWMARRWPAETRWPASIPRPIASAPSIPAPSDQAETAPDQPAPMPASAA